MANKLKYEGYNEYYQACMAGFDKFGIGGYDVKQHKDKKFYVSKRKTKLDKNVSELSANDSI